jgi:Outer membrane lipoprotein-sorting protein
MRTPMAYVVVAALVGAPCCLAAAEEITAPSILRRMKEALEPARPSVRSITIRLQSRSGEATQWLAAQARKDVADAHGMLTVVLAPDPMRGVALLVRDRPSEPELHMYVPAVRRARRLLPVEVNQSFFGTDITYGDLGFVDLRPQSRLLGTEERDGKRMYRVEEVPAERWYYARIVSVVSADSWLPLEREFYDAANALWKTQRIGRVTRIQDVPTPLSVRMENVQEGSSTELEVTSVRYDVELPEVLFDPARLDKALASPVWGAASPH